MDTTHTVIDAITIEWTTIPWWITVLVCAAAVAWPVWHYRNTIPPVSGWKRWLLTCLRATALVLVILLLAGPVIHTRSTVTRQSDIAVLFDTSSSMSMPTDPERAASAISSLASLRNHLGNHGTFYDFNTGIHPLTSDTPDFSGTGTDISLALASVSSDPDVSGIVLLSDGRWNLGENPESIETAEGIPVHTITAGSADITGDIVIDGLSAPSIGRAGDSLHVEVTVSSQTAITGSVPVTINGPGGTVGTGQARFDQSSRSIVLFDIPLQRPGDMEFTAEVTPGDTVGDLTPENNRRTFDVHVLKRTFFVLLIANRPSADLAFLRRALEHDESLSPEVVIAGGVGDQDTSTVLSDLNRYDAVVVLDGGGMVMTEQFVSGKLKPWLSAGKGLWLLGSTIPKNPDLFSGMLPVTLTGGAMTAGETSIVRTDAGQPHPVTSSSPDGQLLWDNLPPVPSVFSVAERSPQSRVLAVSTAAASEKMPVPALISGTFGTGKVLVMPVSGIWRWKLMLEGTGRNETFYTSFVTGAVRWLTAETSISPLDVSTDKRTYLGGEEIKVTARPHDAVYNPVSGAEVVLVVDGNPATKTILRETAPAEYTGVLRGITTGDHTLSVTAFSNDVPLGEQVSDITVQAFSLEQLDMRPDFRLMSSLAEKTGGIALTAPDIGRLLPLLKPNEFTERREDRYPVRGRLPLLIFAIALLAIEWSIRKRLGML